MLLVRASTNVFSEDEAEIAFVAGRYECELEVSASVISDHLFSSVVGRAHHRYIRCHFVKSGKIALSQPPQDDGLRVEIRHLFLAL